MENTYRAGRTEPNMADVLQGLQQLVRRDFRVGVAVSVGGGGCGVAIVVVNCGNGVGVADTGVLCALCFVYNN